MRRFITLLALLPVTACSVLTGISPDYPESWPSLKRLPYTCSHLVGQFENDGIATHASRGGSRYLIYELGIAEGLDSFSALHEVNPIRIRCIEGDKLVFEGLHGNKIVKEKTLSRTRNEWVANKEGIEVVSRQESEADALGGHTGRRTLVLSLAEDGSLIGRERFTSAGLLFWLIPLGGPQTFWHQWQRVQSP
jgi:hypothetical protein